MDRLQKFFLIGVLCIALFIRFYGLSNGDTLSDEADYGYRSVGYLDYVDQPLVHSTPIEWLDPRRPFWLSLSFHDAPPLFFIVQHASLEIFGVNTFGMRFPSALFGFLSVILIFFVGKELLNKTVGLIASLLASVSVSMVFISRIGLIESSLIFILLLTLFFYLKGRRNTTYFIWMGLAFGLGLLTKYTELVMGGIIGLDLLLWNRALLKSKKLWLGIIIACIMQTPVVIYNIYLFKTFGHFDHAIMDLLGKQPKVWAINPGRNVGSLSDRFLSFFPSQFQTYFWPLLCLFFPGVFYSTWNVIKRKGKDKPVISFFLVSCAFLFLCIIVLGPSSRFLAMASPMIILYISFLLYKTWEKYRRNHQTALILSFSVIAGLSFLYSINTFLLPRPTGTPVLMYSPVQSDLSDWGYNSLDGFFQHVLSGRYPSFVVVPKYTFLQNILRTRIADAKANGEKPFPAVIIYDQNLYNSPTHWIFDRMNTYDGWPTMTTEEYLNFIKKKENIKQLPANTVFYFVSPEKDILLRPKNEQTEMGLQFANKLTKLKASQVLITSRDNYAAFTVFAWQNALPGL